MTTGLIDYLIVKYNSDDSSVGPLELNNKYYHPSIMSTYFLPLLPQSIASKSLLASYPSRTDEWVRGEGSRAIDTKLYWRQLFYGKLRSVSHAPTFWHFGNIIIMKPCADPLTFSSCHIEVRSSSFVSWCHAPSSGQTVRLLRGH